MISKSQIKHIQSLHLKKFRQEEQLFIAEGVKIVNEFLENPQFRPKAVYATAPYLASNARHLHDLGIEHWEVSEEELKKISQQSTPNQVLAICSIAPQKPDTEALRKGLTLFLDEIKDPGNLGTIIRIADWFGIAQVVCSPGTAELYNPKTIQSTMGAMLRVPVLYMTLQELLALAGKVPVYGAVLDGENIYASTPGHGILVIGNEANGISGEVMAQLTHRITIPAANNNGSESLNAAVATAILCSEFSRAKLS